MRAVAFVLVALLALAGCDDEPHSLGTQPLSFDPVCELMDVTVDEVTYRPVAVDETGPHATPPEDRLGPYPQPGTLERFDDGTAVWTGNGYEVTFDSRTETGKYQVC